MKGKEEGFMWDRPEIIARCALFHIDCASGASVAPFVFQRLRDQYPNHGEEVQFPSIFFTSIDALRDTAWDSAIRRIQG
jgi:glutamate/tyrosine decarboxylase-like PLP-dependent enzyme